MAADKREFVECAKCKSLLANDDPKLWGKLVDCPKCGAGNRLRKPSSPTLTDHQLLGEIHAELVKANKVLTLFYILMIINMVCAIFIGIIIMFNA
jgi:phage FluMu protein Com